MEQAISKKPGLLPCGLKQVPICTDWAPLYPITSPTGGELAGLTQRWRSTGENCGCYLLLACLRKTMSQFEGNPCG